jgi:YbbR domain-containing protein
MERNSRNIMANKNFNLVASILIAIFLWVYVISEVNPLTEQTMTKIPVQLLNAQTIYDRELALSGDQNLTVDVVLEGKRADIIKVTSDEIIANADLFGFGKGENYLTVSVSVPDGVKIKSVNPAKIKVFIEQRISANKNVTISYAGPIIEGKEAGRITINPSELEVTGPESLVNLVDHINATVNLATLKTEPGTFEIKTVPMDAQGNIIENVSVSSGMVKVTAQMLDTKVVPLVPTYIGTIDANYDANSLLIPATVKIKGTADILAGVSSIATSEINLSELSPTNKVLVKEIYPEGVEPASGSEQVYVEISIKDTISSQLLYDSTELQIIGLDSNLNASVSNTTLTITLTGKTDIISIISKQDIVPTIDLTGAKAGENNYNVSLQYTKNLDKTVVEPGVVYVIITEK